MNVRVIVSVIARVIVRLIVLVIVLVIMHVFECACVWLQAKERKETSERGVIE